MVPTTPALQAPGRSGPRRRSLGLQPFGRQSLGRQPFGRQPFGRQPPRQMELRPEEVLVCVAETASAIARTITVTSGRWPARPARHSTDRTGVRVLSTDDYDVWLLRWPAGTAVTPHDHGPSVGAFCVVRGSLVEMRWQDGQPAPRAVGPAETVTVGRGVVHDVIGVTDGSLSVHVYSPPLSLMNYYDDSGAVLVGSELVGSADEHDATSVWTGVVGG